jgi:hypothetical protein
MNEEMYEEEDDDLPMQYRRINALNPSLAYSAFNERVNNYLAGQIGVRNYLHQAIYQANQNYHNNSFFNNPMMQQQQQQQQQQHAQQSWQMNGQGSQPSAHAQSSSITTPQGFAQHHHADHGSATTPVNGDAPRQSLPPQQSATSPGASSPATTQSKSTPTASQPPTPAASQPNGLSHNLSPANVPQSPYDSSMYPLTTKLPIEAQQLLAGQEASFGVQPYQLTPGIPMPSMSGYTYNPNGKSSMKRGSVGAALGLDQTLSPYNMHSSSQQEFGEPSSTACALDFNFGYDMFGGGNDDFSDSKYAFNLGLGGDSSANGDGSGQVTPAGGMDSSWNPDDFFNYSAASD